MILQTRFVYRSGATITTIHNQFKRFRVDNFDLKDEDSSHPVMTNTDFIKAMLAENLRYSVREIMNIISILKTTVHNYLIRMGYINRCKVWIPQLSTETGFMNRVSTCDFSSDMKEILSKQSLLLESRFRFCIKMCMKNAFCPRTIDL